MNQIGYICRTGTILEVVSNILVNASLHRQPVKLLRIGVMWSHFLDPEVKRAAAFWILCGLCSSRACKPTNNALQ